MRQALSTAILSLTAWCLTTAAFANPSPLKVVTDGRTHAKTSKMTEQGLLATTQSGVNILLYACGGLGILLVGIGLYQQYWSFSDRAGPQASRVSPIAMVVFGSLLTISAVIAAVLPNALL